VTVTSTATSLVESAFFWFELFALTISTLIGIAATLLIQRYLNAPKIRGGIFGIIEGDWEYMGEKKTAFWPYVYLTNEHRNAVWPLDYEFEADFGDGYVKLERVYGDIRKLFPETLEWKILGSESNPPKVELEINDLRRHTLSAKAQPIHYGSFLSGLVMFVIPSALENKTVYQVRFTCIDAFRKRHSFEAHGAQLLSMALFSELLQLTESTGADAQKTQDKRSSSVSTI
jgi:hypothetical protein